MQVCYFMFKGPWREDEPKESSKYRIFTQSNINIINTMAKLVK